MNKNINIIAEAKDNNLITARVNPTDKGFKVKIRSSEYGYFTESEISDLLNIPVEEFIEGMDNKGVLFVNLPESRVANFQGNRISESGIFLSDNNKDLDIRLDENLKDTVSCFIGDSSITLATKLVDGVKKSVVIVNESGETKSSEFNSESEALSEAMDTINSKLAIGSVLESMPHSQIAAMFAKGYLKKGKRGKLKYSKRAFKSGRPRKKGGTAEQKAKRAKSRAYAKKRKLLIKNKEDSFSSGVLPIRGTTMKIKEL